MPDLHAPPTEHFSGRIVEQGPNLPSALILGRGKLPNRAHVLYHGDVSIYFAFPLLMTTDMVFPQLVIDDFQRQFNGHAAIEFMLTKGNSYPRADAVGLRLSTMQRADLFMKEVDVAAGLRALAYAGPLEGPPLARIGSVVWLDAQARQIDVGFIPPDEDVSLFKHAAHLYRCSPADLPILLQLPPESGGS